MNATRAVVGGEERSLAALVERLDAAVAGGFPVGVAPGLRAEGDGWASVDELTAAPYERLGAMVRDVELRWDAPPHVAAALLWKGISYWTALPVATGWAINRRVPLMTAEHAVLRVLPDEPHLQAGLREVRVASGEVGELGAAIRDSLILDLHAPLIEALHALTRVGRRGLWGSTAEALVQPIVAFGADLLDDPAGAAEVLLRSVGGPVSDLVVLPAMRRRTCCLWVTLPEADACATCCLNA